MISVKYGKYDSSVDFGLIYKSDEMQPPQLKTNYVEIMGRTNPLDLTNFFGKNMYEQREIKHTFKLIKKQVDIEEFKIDISNKLIGKDLKIILSNVLDYYFYGKVTNISFTYGENFFYEVEISCICNPFRLKVNETVVSSTIINQGLVLCNNLKMKVIPNIEVNKNVDVEFEGKTYQLTKGNNKNNEIIFDEGINELKFIGNAEIKVIYREGGL